MEGSKISLSLKMEIIKVKSELVYKLRMRNLASKHRHPKVDNMEQEYNRTYTDGQQLLDYPKRRGSQTGSEGRALSLLHRVPSLQDGPQ